MNYTCPGCQTTFDGRALQGLAVVHCPTCGRGFEPYTIGAGSEAAWAGATRTSRLAVLALVAGVGSLVAPFCICPAVFFVGMAAAAPRPATVTFTAPAAPRPTPVTPVVTVTLPDGTTKIVPAPPPPPPGFEEEIIPEDEDEDEDAGGK